MVETMRAGMSAKTLVTNELTRYQGMAAHMREVSPAQTRPASRRRHRRASSARPTVPATTRSTAYTSITQTGILADSDTRSTNREKTTNGWRRGSRAQSGSEDPIAGPAYGHSAPGRRAIGAGCGSAGCSAAGPTGTRADMTAGC